MKDIEENNLSMKIAVEKVLTENEALWSGIPQFAASVSLYKTKIGKIVQERQKQEKHINGITQNKLSAKKAMCRLAVEISSIVMAYAESTDDNELKNTVNYSWSDLVYQRDSISRDCCLLIYNTALPLDAQLADFGLVAGKLPELNSAIANYTEMLSAPRTAMGERKTSRMNIEKLLKESDRILKNSIDKMMVPFKTSQPDFYNTYSSARMIIDYGKRHHKPVCVVSGKAIDFESGEILINVKVYLEGDEKNLVRSDEKGAYSLNVYHAGEKVLIAEKEGYVKYEEILDISKGEDQEVNIDMEKSEGSSLPEAE